jgi:hypothetical protein
MVELRTLVGSFPSATRPARWTTHCVPVLRRHVG